MTWPKPTTWDAFEREAEAAVAECAQAIQSLLPAKQIYCRYLGRVRSLARETTETTGDPEAVVDARVAPYDARLVEICGLG